jgi:hypothetical protein
MRNDTAATTEGYRCSDTTTTGKRLGSINSEGIYADLAGASEALLHGPGRSGKQLNNSGSLPRAKPK